MIEAKTYQINMVRKSNLVCRKHLMQIVNQFILNSRHHFLSHHFFALRHQWRRRFGFLMLSSCRDFALASSTYVQLLLDLIKWLKPLHPLLFCIFSPEKKPPILLWSLRRMVQFESYTKFSIFGRKLVSGLLFVFSFFLLFLIFFTRK